MIRVRVSIFLSFFAVVLRSYIRICVLSIVLRICSQAALIFVVRFSDQNDEVEFYQKACLFDCCDAPFSNFLSPVLLHCIFLHLKSCCCVNRISLTELSASLAFLVNYDFLSMKRLSSLGEGAFLIYCNHDCCEMKNFNRTGCNLFADSSVC